MTAFIASLMLALVVGFAAHRASICTVRAVAEAMHARTAFMLVSIAKSVLWILLVTVPVFWLMPESVWSVSGWQLTTWALAGGFLFGFGAAVNGACAYSTMARLVDGEVGMAVAITGFALGVFVFAALVDGGVIARPAYAPALITRLLSWSAAIVAVLAILGLVEAIRLWLTRPRDRRLHAMPLAHQYRLSSAAMLVGLGGAGIFVLFGSAGYSSTYALVIEGALGTRPWPTTARWILLFAVLAGMALSTLQRRTFRFDWRPRRLWLRNFAGGTMMGLGTALTPGGNDALVLYGIPSLSPHALPAFAALLIGSIAGLVFMRRLFGIEMRVACRKDTFVSDTWTPEGLAGGKT